MSNASRPARCGTSKASSASTRTSGICLIASGTTRPDRRTMAPAGMKIGLVSPYDYTHPGGVTHHIKNLGTWLQRLGHEVQTFAPSSRQQAEREIPNFYRIGRVFSVPVNDSVARITLSFHLASRVMDICARE